MALCLTLLSCGGVETREEAEKFVAEKRAEQKVQEELVRELAKTPRLMAPIKSDSLAALNELLGMPRYRPPSGTEQNQLGSSEQLPSQLGSEQLPSSTEQHIQPLARQAPPRKVAILDNGFYGFERALGDTLPLKVNYMTTKGVPEKPTSHGLIMAEQFVGMVRHSLGPQADPELYLIVSNGYLSLKAAVDMAIAAGVDMILYSQVWEFSLNVNEVISKATQHGIVWVNASGNFHQRISTGKLKRNSLKDTFTLPHHRGDFLEFKVKKQEQPVKITYSWRSANYKKAVAKDLNLNLYDSAMKKVISSDHRRTVTVGDKESYDVPMKFTQPILQPGKYYIELEDISKNFVDRDMFKISIDGLDVAISEGGYLHNAIQAPATHPAVICVTANDYPYAANNSAGVGGRVPDLSIPSKIILEDGTTIRSTSTAAAAAAAKIYTMSQVDNIRFLTKSVAIGYF